MKKTLKPKSILAILCLSIFNFNPSFAVSTQDFLESINVDLPPATVSCRASGSLANILPRIRTFKSGGNAFFVDIPNQEIAVFERAVTEDEEENRKVSANMFIRIKDVERNSIQDLLLRNRTLVTKNAYIIFTATVETENGIETYINESKDANGNPIYSTIFTSIKRVGNLSSGGGKFVTADIDAKIKFPSPPKRINSDGTLSDVFDEETTTLTCTCIRCPIHDFDLIDLENAFDKELTDDILEEASKNN